MPMYNRGAQCVSSEALLQITLIEGLPNIQGLFLVTRSKDCLDAEYK